MENYPNLRSVETVTNLMDETCRYGKPASVSSGVAITTGTRLQYRDQEHSEEHAAGMFGWTEGEYFTSVSGADQVPKVEF